MPDKFNTKQQLERPVCLEPTLEEIQYYKNNYVVPRLNKGLPKKFLNDWDAPIVTLAIMERSYPKTKKWKITEQVRLALEVRLIAINYINKLLRESSQEEEDEIIGSESAIVIRCGYKRYKHASTSYAKQYSRKIKSKTEENGEKIITQQATDFQQEGKDPPDRYRDYAEDSLALDLCDLAAKLDKPYKAVLAWLYVHGKGTIQIGDFSDDSNASISEFVKQYENHDMFKYSKLTIQKVSHMINIIKSLIAEHSPQTYSCTQVEYYLHLRNRMRHFLAKTPEGFSRRQLTILLNAEKNDIILVADQLIAYGEASVKRAIKTDANGVTKPTGPIFYVANRKFCNVFAIQ